MNHLAKLYLIIVLTISLSETANLNFNTCVSPLEDKHSNNEVYCYYYEWNRIFIRCKKELLENLFDIRIKFYTLKYIEFQNCTFAQTASVQNILHSMANVQPQQISFVNFTKFPNRLNFQNLSISDIILSNGNVSELPYDLFYNVLQVCSVGILKTQITHIPKKFFNDWAESVTKLFLRQNRLRKIAREDFSRLTHLIELDLFHNEIDEIKPGAFDSLTHLVKLDLGNNRLSTLPPGIFNELTHLRRIILCSRTRHNYFRPEERIMFEMTSLPSNLFRGAYNLNEIEVTGHNLESLPLELFHNNQRLVILDLRKNGLKFLPVGIFKTLKRLAVLMIDENHLTSLLPDVCIGLDSLRYLQAQKNNLTWIDVRIFNYLRSAVEIDLSHNQITAFEYSINGKLQFESTFTFTNKSENFKFQQLEFFNLSSNHFTDLDVIPVLIHGYFNLTSNTNLHYNPLKTDFIEELELTKTIDLSNNYISKINFTALSSVTTQLDKFNTIGYITVYIANNSLHCDCNLMDFIRYLNGSHHQNLKKNCMIFSQEKSHFGADFTCSSPPELKNRDVRKIHLEEFHCMVQTSAFGKACNNTCRCQQYPEKKFLSIDCSFRNLSKFPEIQNSVYNWSIALNMSGNALTSIPPLNNSYLANITDLDLSRNNITEVSLDVFSPNLRVLKLHNNNIARFDPNIIQYLARDNSLQRLTIHGNKWICNCQTHNKILQSSIRKKLSNYNFHEVLCYGTNRTLYEVTVAELCEHTIILIISVSFTIIFLGFLIGSLAALYSRYQKQIKIWLYSRQLCLWFVTEDELDRDKKYDAFISFSREDENFVQSEIIAELEAGPRPYMLCICSRDWLSGEWVPWQISRSVADSKRTIIILSTSFLVTVWGLLEFRSAHTQELQEGKARLIFILHGELSNLDNLDQELKDYLSSNTYIKWGDPWFWQKLKYALPHRSRNSH